MGLQRLIVENGLILLP